MNSTAGCFVFFVDIKHNQGVEVPVADMTNDCAMQTDGLEVLLGLENELRKLGNGNAVKGELRSGMCSENKPTTRLSSNSGGLGMLRKWTLGHTCDFARYLLLLRLLQQSQTWWRRACVR